MKEPESFKEKSESTTELSELEKLPEELLLEVLDYTTIKDLSKVTVVNKNFNRLVNDPHLVLHKAKLKKAVMSNQVEIVEKILSINPTDVNHAYEDGMSLLHLLANKTADQQKVYYEITKLLLEKGANVNSVDKNGDTPLHKAVESENIILAQLFIEKGADINAVNAAKQKPADKTIYNSFRIAINDNSGWEGAAKFLQIKYEKNENEGQPFPSFPCGGGQCF